jgi:hypothetical protein
MRDGGVPAGAVIELAAGPIAPVGRRHPPAYRSPG